MKRNLIGLLFLTCLGAIYLKAQTADTILLVHEGRQVPIDAVVIGANAEFAKIRLTDGSFPVILLPQALTHEVFRGYNQQGQLLQTQRTDIDLLRQRDTLNAREIETLHKIMAAQQTNISLCENTNEALNRSIASLNEQLNQTRQLAEDCNKGRNRKNIWAIIVGGGVGFGIGAILGILVAK